MSKSKSKQTQSFNTTTGVDQGTQQYLQQIRDAAAAAGQAGPSPLVTNASGYFGAGQNAGTMGMNALSGDAGATARLMSPYQQQVIDANNTQWQRINQQTQNQVNNQATLAGAFGGSRQGVALGTALNANNLAQAQQNAGLLNQGYSDAMNRANQLAGLGFQSAGANANLGLGGVGSPAQWLMQQLKGGYLGPMSQQTSGGTFNNSSEHGFDLGKLAQGAAALFGAL